MGDQVATAPAGETKPAPTALEASEKTPQPALPSSLEVPDNGLGLKEFLAGGSTAPPDDAGAEAAATLETGAAEKVTPTEKPTDKPVEEKKTAPAADPGAVVPPAIDPKWEVDENPYRTQAREAQAEREKLQKQVKDGRDWGTKINQDLEDLKRQQARTAGILDGSIDPDAAPETPVATPEQMAHQASLIAKVTASNHSAARFLNPKDPAKGMEELNRLIYDDDAPMQAFREDQAVQARILNHPEPALEAIRFLRERTFFKQYGDDPETIRTAIRAEAQTEHEAAFEAEVTKRLQARLTAKERQSPDLGDVRGDQRRVADGGEHTPLAQIGNPGLS